jgi:hypothetical protein
MHVYCLYCLYLYVYFMYMYGYSCILTYMYLYKCIYMHMHEFDCISELGPVLRESQALAGTSGAELTTEMLQTIPWHPLIPTISLPPAAIGIATSAMGAWQTVCDAAFGAVQCLRALSLELTKVWRPLDSITHPAHGPEWRSWSLHGGPCLDCCHRTA